MIVAKRRIFVSFSFFLLHELDIIVPSVPRPCWSRRVWGRPSEIANVKHLTPASRLVSDQRPALSVLRCHYTFAGRESRLCLGILSIFIISLSTSSTFSLGLSVITSSRKTSLDSRRSPIPAQFGSTLSGMGVVCLALGSQAQDCPALPYSDAPGGDG